MTEIINNNIISQYKNSETFKLITNDNEELSNIPSHVEDMREYFNSNKTLDVNFRKKQLENLYKSIKEHEEDLYNALRIDMGKPDIEIMISEIGVVLHEISFARKNLKKWAKIEKVKTPFYNYGNKSYRYPVPKGVVLIIGPWNYPFQLMLEPIVGAIAAGCCVVIKPSDYAYETTNTIYKIFSETFDDKYLKVIKGDAEASEKLLNLKWDHVFFTGSTRVGKIVHEKASKHLTTVTLELGGLNPAIIDKTANIKKTVDSIVMGKWLNLGQSCVAPNHIYLHEDIQEQFTQEFIKEIKKRFGENPIESPYLARINNVNHFKRLVSQLDQGEIILGGKFYEKELFIEPTVLVNVDLENSNVLSEEIFGPILPIVPFNDTTLNLDAIIKRINSSEEPLSVYLFSKDKNIHKKVLNEVKAQNFLINDTVMQFINPYLPFGGTGNSGMGGYHGKFTFDEFTLKKSVMHQNSPIHILRWTRKPPYNKLKLFLTKYFFK